MEQAFRRGDFEQGVMEGIRNVGKHLAQHYPHVGPKQNELSDQPVLLP
jgi:uncharacterized membrane protein